MRIAVGVFVLFVVSFQICNAQQYYPNFYLDSFFFYNGPSTATEGNANVYLINTGDAFSSSYNPALPSYSNNVRFSYSTSQKINNGEHILYDNYGVDVPIKNIGTVSLTRRYFDYKFYIGPDLGPNQLPEGSINYASYNLNYSREIYKGLSCGIGINHFIVDVPYVKGYDKVYNELNLGASYIYNLPGSDYFSQYAMANISVMNIPTTYTKTDLYTDTFLPQIDHVSLGYISKYGKTNNLDVFQAEIQIEYSDLLNSKYYNSIGIGGEIKFLEIVSIRAGYYNIKGDYFSDDEITDGLGFSYPFKVYLEIPLVIGVDYARSKFPDFDPNTKYYFNSYALYLKYDM